MKNLLIFVFCMLSASVYAQSTDLAPINGTAVEIIQSASALSDAPKLASGPWFGKSQVMSLPSVALAQSFVSADQALGIHKDLWSLYKGNYEIIRVGGFAGFYKPLLSSPSQGPKSLGGATVLIPGSAFDWALGTDWGSKWLPSLKSGILVAYDLTKPSALRFAPEFCGPIISYKLGQTDK